MAILLEELVEQHNAMQPRERPVVSGARVVEVIVAGKYANRKGRAQVCAVGDELLTRVWYAEWMVGQGLACWPGEREVEAAAAVDDDWERIEAVVEEVRVVELRLRPAVVDGLRAAGFGTAAAMRGASDGELLAVRGVGRVTVARIREALEHGFGG